MRNDINHTSSYSSTHPEILLHERNRNGNMARVAASQRFVCFANHGDPCTAFTQKTFPDPTLRNRLVEGSMHEDAVCEKNRSGEEDEGAAGDNGKSMQAISSSKMLYPCLNIALGFWP